MTTLPFSYQIQDARQIHRFGGRALLASEMGTGKSLVSLLYAQRHNLFPFIVVCPCSIKWNWEKECLIHLGIRAEVLEGTKPVDIAITSAPQPQALIINYDVLSSWLPYLKSLEPKLVIIDEAVYIKSPRARRTKAVRSLCKKTPHVLALGGTGGMNNRPAEIWPTLNILRPDLFPSFHAFGFAYCQPRKTMWGWEFKGASNLPKLHKLLRENLMIRRRKADILPNLPSKRRIITLLEIAKRDEYNRAVNDFLGWVRSEFSLGHAMRAAKSEQITRLSYLKRLVAQLKLPSVIDWTESFLDSTRGKLILFAIHHGIVDKLHERFKNLSVVVTGETLGSKRKLAFHQFLQDKRMRILIGNIQAAGQGWSAIGVPTTAFAEFAWTPAEHAQAEDRTHGFARGSIHGHSSDYYYLTAWGTIEIKLAEAIQKKQGVLNDILDGHKVEGALDIYDSITKELLADKQSTMGVRDEKETNSYG